MLTRIFITLVVTAAWMVVCGYLFLLVARAINMAY